MTTHPERFEPAALAGLDEPVRRFLAHAIDEGAALPAAARLRMRGRVKAGAWMPFEAQQETGPDAFRWTARVGLAGLTVLKVVDRHADGAGAMEGRLFGRRRVFGAGDEHTTRSAAGRAALEAATFAPATLLRHGGVAWRAESDDVVVATWDVAPERPEVRIRIDERGAVRATWAQRWGDAGGGRHDYVPCGAEVRAERRFGAYVVPSDVVVAWWFGTPRAAPFFRAGITEYAAVE